MTHWQAQERRWGSASDEGDAVTWATQLVRPLRRAVVAGWDTLRPHVGAFAAVGLYLVAVYLIGRR